MKGGFPDSGEGRYAAKLDYEAWVILNKCNRYHSEFVQKLPLFVIVLMVSGLYLPKLAMIVGICNAVVRFLSIMAFMQFGSECKGLKFMKDYTGNGPMVILGIATFIY